MVTGTFTALLINYDNSIGNSILYENMYFLLYFLLLLLPSYGIEHFEQEIWNYISDVIDLKGSFAPHIVEPLSYQTVWQPNQLNEPKLVTYLYPRILLWDPMNQYPVLLKDHFICREHGTILTASHWRSKKTMQPRWIYDEQGAVLLVQRMYQCRKNNTPNHGFLSGELTVTEQLPACIELPFKLSHRAAFTISLETDIVERYI